MHNLTKRFPTSFSWWSALWSTGSFRNTTAPLNNRPGGGNLAWFSDIQPMGGYLHIKKIWEEGGLHGLSEIPPMGGNLVSLSSVLKSCQQNGFQCCSQEIPSACTNEVLHTATAWDKKQNSSKKRSCLISVSFNWTKSKKYVNKRYSEAISIDMILNID